MFSKLTDLADRIRTRRLPDERKLYPHLFELRPEPELTVGTIVLRALLKTAVIVFVSWFVVEYFRLEYYWFVPLALIFFLAIFPAYQQYQSFQDDSKRLVGDTMCAKCKHFDETSVTCRLYDEHVSKNHIPCGGDSWEMRQPFQSD